MMLNHLDLFSGIGGFALAARWVGGIRTIGFCDNEKYARQVLAKNFPGVPIYEDVRELHPDVIVSRDGRIDFLTCGFPCQDLSVAGNQKGIEAERSGLFFEITRLSDEILAYCGTRPSLVLENVPNLLTGNGGDWARTVYSELAVRGYRCEWKIISASDVGAPHLRKRWWCLAYLPYSKSLHGNVSNDYSRVLMEGQSISESGDRGRENDMAHTKRLGWSTGSVEQGEDGGGGPPDHTGDCSEALSNPKIIRMEGYGTSGNQESYTHGRETLSVCQGQRPGYAESKSQPRLGGALPDGLSPWMDEPGDIPRVTTGQKNRVSRLKGLGNAVVPQCAMIPLMRLKEILT